MRKSRVLKARVTPQDMLKLEQLCERTGYNRSQMIRLLIDHAELKPWYVITLGQTDLGNNKDAEQAV